MTMLFKPAKKAPLLAGGFAVMISFVAAFNGALQAEPIPPPYPDRLDLLSWRDEQGGRQEVHQPADWQRRQAHVLAGMQLVMGPLPGEGSRVPLDVRQVEQVQLDGITRRKLNFQSDPA